MKRFWLFAGCLASAFMAQADVVTVDEHSSGDTPVIDLSTILNEWGTPSDTTSAFTIGGTGTDFIDGLNIINDTGMTITSLQLYAYGTVGGSTFKYDCGVNNFFTSCSPVGQVDVAANSTVSQGSPVEWTWFGTSGANQGITEGTEFRLVDTEGAQSAGTDMFYEVEINGHAPTAPTPEPATVIPMGAGLLAMGLLFARKRKTATAASAN
jgi:hypothetical protein